MPAISTAKIKQIKSLSLKKFRDELGLFTVEGEKCVEEALASSFDVVEVWRRDEIGEKAMERMSALSSPSPILAVVRKPLPMAADVPSGGLFLGLDGIRDPGNLGTIIRTAAWFGIERIYASPDTVDVFNPKVVQASMGAIFRVPVIYCDLPRFCGSISEAGGRIYGTFLDGEDIFRKDLGCESPASLILIGNESEGISAQCSALVTDRITIPSFSQNPPESLNASVAAAVTLAEFRRRLQ